MRILEAIYETDFIDDSYGFRPERGCHDALRALSLEVEGGTIHYIVEGMPVRSMVRSCLVKRTISVGLAREKRVGGAAASKALVP